MRILLVDDSKTILHVMSKMLKELGYAQIDLAENPIEAQEKVKLFFPDLIISDWNMPKGSGLDLLKYIRTNKDTAKIPFIILTSDHDKSKIAKAKEYKPQFYLLKPTTKPQLAERLNSLAETHGIQPPVQVSQPAIKSSTDYSTEDETEEMDNNRQDSTSKKNMFMELESNNEGKTRILNKLLLVLNREIEHISFRKWLVEKYFSTSPENLEKKDIDKLAEMLNTTIQETLHSIYDI